MNADPRVMEYFTGVMSRDASDTLASQIQSHIEQHGWGLWAVEIPGVAPFAGFTGLSTPRFTAHFTPCVEIGWRLAPEFWGLGYATEGALAALAYGFDTVGLDEVVSFTAVMNTRSRRVMERLGMTYDPRDDFDYPDFSTDHLLRRHVLYRKRKGPRQ